LGPVSHSLFLPAGKSGRPSAPQVYHPVELEYKEALRRTLGLPLSETLVIYTGRLVSYKGLPLLLESWQSLQRRHNGIHLLLVGSGGLDIHNCEQELRQFVQNHGLAGSVHFTGSVEHVHHYLFQMVTSR
jgi:glycosyltransferase involved in cell wall biosynthesis